MAACTQHSIRPVNRGCHLQFFAYSIKANYEIEMKIAIINNLYWPNSIGGAERSVQLLAESLQEKGIEVSVYSLDKIHRDEISNVNGVKVHYLPLMNLYWPYGRESISRFWKLLWHIFDISNIRMCRLIYHLLEIEKPDLVHTNNLTGFSIGVWGAARRLRLPIVHTLRDYYLLCPRTTMFRDGSNCKDQCIECHVLSKLKKKATYNVDVVVGISHFLLEKHLQHGLFPYSGKKIIYNPHIGYVRPKISNHNVPMRPLRLGYLGRITPAKGIRILLESVARFPDGTIELLIAGEGETGYIQLLKSINNGKNVRFLGFVHPEILFRSIDILVVPSLWHEPLGRSVIEAKAYGIPVIGSNRGGLSELIECGKNGLLFDPSGVDNLAKTIEIVIKNPDIVSLMSKTVLQEAQYFSPNIIANKYLELYCDLL